MSESENSETLADIVAEMRRREKSRYYPKVARNIMHQYADRIEAAEKREKAECEALALSVGGIVEASRHKQVGNAAAMREALEKIVELTASCEGVTSIELQVQAEALTALSTPPRNYELYNDVEDSWRDYKQFRSQKGEDIYFDMVHFWPFAKWLFAPASERKGEDDASK